MTRRFDCFMFNNELDMLELRLTELEDVDVTHVLVEATRSHGHNKPKPLHYLENAHRFDKWSDRIVHVVADGLPDDDNPWTREHGQREWFFKGLEGAEPADIVLQSDVDEIPDAELVELIQPSGFVAFAQRMHCFAIDWQHPHPWRGTVAARYGQIATMAKMRDRRTTAPHVLPDAGWHFSWVGGETVADEKMSNFCHHEIEPRWAGRLGECYRSGVHVDGVQMIPVEVDDTYPKWIREGNAPTTWYRPR